MFSKKNKKSKTVFVSLSHKYISVAFEENSELMIESDEFDIQKDIDILVELWSKKIEKILEKVKFKPSLVLLVNSSSFLVKNLYNIETEAERYKYISRQLDIPKGFFEITNIKNDSYLVVEDKMIKKILFSFKEYEIKGIHDASILNSLYSLKKDNELYLNISLHCIDVIFNGKNFQKRSSNNLFINYLESSAKDLNLEINDVYRHIRKNFESIKSYDELNNSTQIGAIDLQNFIDELLNYIEETLKFFHNYEQFNGIETIYLDGDLLDLKFIVLILQEKLEVEIVLLNNQLNLSNYQKITPSIAYDKFESEIFNSSTTSLDGLRYSDGNQELIFVDNTFVSQKKLTKEQKSKIIQFTRVKETKKKKIVKENESILETDDVFEWIKNKFISKSDGEDEFEETNEVKNKDEQRKLFFLMFLVSLSLPYYFNEYFLISFDKKFQNSVNNFVNNMETLNNNKMSSSTELNVVGNDANKILWTEKLTTISNSIPDAIWLSSIRVENQKENKKESKVLLEGKCLPSTNGHVFTIAEYMESIMNSDENFTKDFDKLEFLGAENIYDNTIGKNLIHFTLECNFQKNKNINKDKENR